MYQANHSHSHHSGYLRGDDLDLARNRSFLTCLSGSFSLTFTLIQAVIQRHRRRAPRSSLPTSLMVTTNSLPPPQRRRASVATLSPRPASCSSGVIYLPLCSTSDDVRKGCRKFAHPRVYPTVMPLQPTVSGMDAAQRVPRQPGGHCKGSFSCKLIRHQTFCQAAMTRSRMVPCLRSSKLF